MRENDFHVIKDQDNEVYTHFSKCDENICYTMILILADELLVHFRKKCRNVGSAGWETASHFSFAIDRKRSMRFTDLQILPTSNHQSLCEVVQSCSTPEDTLLPVSLKIVTVVLGTPVLSECLCLHS